MAASSLLRVVVTRRLPPFALKHFSNAGITYDMWDSDEPMSHGDLLKAIADPRGTHGIVCLLSDAIDTGVLAAAPALKVVSTMSVGYSHIDVKACKAKGIKVGYTPGVLTDATADLTLALTLATARRIPEAERAVRTGEWSSWKPFWMTGKGLYGSTVGIVGLGRIGSAVARRFKGFDCKIIYTGRSGPKPDFEAECPGSEYASLEQLLRSADYVVLLCALTPETRGLIDYDKLSLMKSDAILINVARGEVIVQEDLARILQERPKFRAGLDVTVPEPLPTGSPLLNAPNCVVLPHIGSATQACREEMAEITVLNAVNALTGKPLVSELFV